MWLEKIRIRRQLASNNAAIRIQAVAALDAISDLEILHRLAAADADATVRSAAIGRLAEPEMLQQLAASENDPALVDLIARRLDQIYGDRALQACAEDRECDAFDRIQSSDTLIKVALTSNSPALVLAAGARLAQQTEVWQQLIAQLADDKLAMELYSRNMPEPDSGIADYLLERARSNALREAIKAERRRRQELAQAYSEAEALLSNIEQAAEAGDEERYEYFCNAFRQLNTVSEQLKTRFFAARYRFFRAREEQLASQEAYNRDRAIAENLYRQLCALQNTNNWKLIRQTVESWERNGLNKAPGAADFRIPFSKLAAILESKVQNLQRAWQQANACIEHVYTSYQQMLASPEVPALEERQKLLQDMENACSVLGEMPENPDRMRDAVLNAERELRRRARAQAQARDIARWEHYTVKSDICTQLEKLAAVPDDKLPDAARTFRTLRERWNSIGGVPNEKFEELRNRYHSACSALHERLEAFFARRDAMQKAAREQKEKILAEAENLSGSDDWSETSARLKELQDLWKNAGYAGGSDRELFEKFHAACDAFFVRRNGVWEERKKAYLAAGNRKKELCEAVEALKDVPFSQAKKEIALLREQWRTIASAGKDDRILYTRFNRAIDAIFTAHREAGDEVRRQAEIVCTDLAALLAKARSGALPVKDVERDLRDNQQRWEALESRPRDVAARREDIVGELQEIICRLHHEEAMHKLDSAEQLENVIDPGEDQDKLIDHLGRRLKVCGELEERLRECSIISGGGDLAGELQQAFAGNFGGDKYQLTIAELDEFLQRFVAVGQVPPDAREAVFERFRTLYNRALDELQKDADPVAEE